MHAIAESPTELFEAAMTDFRAGARDQAAARCREILAGHAAHPGANHLLGVLLYQQGDSAQGEMFVRTALSAHENAEALCDLALTLKAQRRFDEGAAALRRAIELSPGFALAHNNLGRLLEERGDHLGAETAFRRALDTDANFAEAHFRLGKLLSNTHRPKEARGPLERAIALRPSADALNSLAIVFDQLGAPAEADAMFHRAIELQPDFAEARCNLGMRFQDSGRIEEAEAMLRSAVEANPRFAGARIGLGKLLVRLERIDEAIEQYCKSIELAPADAGLHNALGGLLAESGRLEEAEAPLRRAVELLPDFAGAHGNLGSFLLDMRRYAESEASLRRAMELDPNLWMAPYNLSLMMRDTRRLDEGEVMARRVIELAPSLAAARVSLGNVLLGKSAGDITPALDNFRRALELDPELHVAHANLAYATTFATDDGYAIRDETRRFAARFETPYLPETVSFDNDLTPSRRLRVGYVSPDFRGHCQALFMKPLLSNHDHEAVEVFCYASVGHPDDITREFMQYADVWRDVNRLNEDQLAAQIKADRIDILVDLTMHMAKGRPLLFRRRPAPVQVAWLAYPGTTGSPAIDYRLTDPWLDPLETKHLDDRYSEASIRLPDTFWCYDSYSTEHAVASLPARDEGHVTFGCLNNPCKLTDRMFGLWAQVLRKIEGSRMVMLLAEGEARRTVSAKFAAMGVDPARLNFVEYQQREDYLRTYDKIDIVLDTFPYNGHTTSLDAMWMGAPVVSLSGTTPASRAGYSLLSNLDLTDLVSPLETDFVQNAVGLATDMPRLAQLRSELRGRMECSPLMNGKKFARGMEEAFRQMWAKYCASSEQK